MKKIQPTKILSFMWMGKSKTTKGMKKNSFDQTEIKKNYDSKYVNYLFN
jgi:hypothetical protein